MIVTDISVGSGLKMVSNDTYFDDRLKGSLFWDGTQQKFVLFDGSVFHQCSPKRHSIELNGEVQEIVNWAKVKMAKEKQLKKLMQSNVTIKKAVEQLEILLALCNE